MAKSIIQKYTGKYERECFLCREEANLMGYYGELRHTGLHKHHFIFGKWGAFRKLAEKYGLWGYVCNERHHEHGPESPHENKAVRRYLCQVAQRAFVEKHGQKLWDEEFGENYLEEKEYADRKNEGQDCREPDLSGFWFVEVSDDNCI